MGDFLKELTRRKVWFFGGIYLALGWVLLQVAIAIEATLSLPSWVDQITLVFLGLGFPVALLLAWAQESESRKPDPAETEESTRASRPKERPSRSVVILPFDNLSNDPEIGFLADGFTEELTAKIAAWKVLSVTARNTAFRYKGKANNILEIGGDLRVRFLVEGSFRKTQTTIRITAQLIDALKGDHLWAASEDMDTDNIDGETDTVVRRFASGVYHTIISAEALRLTGLPFEDLTADDARDVILQTGFYPFTSKKIAEAEPIAERALVRFPDEGDLKGLAAHIYAWQSVFQSDRRSEYEKKANSALRQALRLDPNGAESLFRATMVSSVLGRNEEALRYARKYQEEYFAHSAASMPVGPALVECGYYQEGLDELDRNFFLDGKYHPDRIYGQVNRGKALLGLGKYKEAEETFRKTHDILGTADTFLHLLIALVFQGELEEARKTLPTYLALPGALHFDKACDWIHRSSSDEAMITRKIEALREVGLDKEGAANA